MLPGQRDTRPQGELNAAGGCHAAASRRDPGGAIPAPRTQLAAPADARRAGPASGGLRETSSLPECQGQLGLPPRGVWPTQCRLASRLPEPGGNWLLQCQSRQGPQWKPSRAVPCSPHSGGKLRRHSLGTLSCLLPPRSTNVPWMTSREGCLGRRPRRLPRTGQGGDRYGRAAAGRFPAALGCYLSAWPS